MTTRGIVHSALILLARLVVDLVTGLAGEHADSAHLFLPPRRELTSPISVGRGLLLVFEPDNGAEQWLGTVRHEALTGASRAARSSMLRETHGRGLPGPALAQDLDLTRQGSVAVTIHVEAWRQWPSTPRRPCRSARWHGQSGVCLPRDRSHPCPGRQAARPCSGRGGADALVAPSQ